MRCSKRWQRVSLACDKKERSFRGKWMVLTFEYSPRNVLIISALFRVSFHSRRRTSEWNPFQTNYYYCFVFQFFILLWSRRRGEGARERERERMKTNEERREWSWFYFVTFSRVLSACVRSLCTVRGARASVQVHGRVNSTSHFIFCSSLSFAFVVSGGVDSLDSARFLQLRFNSEL